jgi:diacylglycerol O-acyltransferase / wax synthase
MLRGVQSPQRLSGQDAGMLYLETATQPLEVFSVLELNTATIPGGYSYDRLRDDLAARMRAVPEFREKLSSRFLSLDHPLWVEDSEFDVDRHVHRIGLRSPGGQTELAEVCGLIAALPLDHRAPLWEMWVIEGLGGAPAGERLAVVLKVHHCAADGVTYADLVSRLCSTEPDSAPPAPVPASTVTNPLRIAIVNLGRYASRPLQLAVNVVPAAMRAAVDTVRRLAAGRAMAIPFTAPRTTLNRRLTAHRNVAFAELELDDVKNVKNHFGVKVNDVVMAVVSGVLRQFLLDRGELPKSSLVAMVPVSVHDVPDRIGRNQVSGMFARLQTQIADPADRLKAVAEANTNAKEHSSAVGATLLQDCSQIVGRVLMGAAKRVYAWLTQFRPMYNVVVSNVPGPEADSYFLGAEVLSMYPFGPVMHGAGLNITVWSVGGKLHFGLISCSDLLPDLWSIAEGLPVGLKELLAEIGTAPTASAAG